jgi:predicted metal-dependent hydrolase
MIGWLRRARSQPPETLQAPPLPTHLRVGDRLLPFDVRRLARARRLTLRLTPDGQAVRLSMPDWVPMHEALAFATSRSDWLAEQIARLPEAAPPGPAGSIAYRGETLQVAWAPDLPRQPRADQGEIRLGGPQDSVPRRLARWLESEARRLIAEDLAHYCQRAGKAVPHLALSRAQRRWGSCAADGTIRINWRLIMAPDSVRRSVVAHEVAHLLHFDHSPAFHACLGALFEGSIDAANAWLKRNGRALYQPFG